MSVFGMRSRILKVSFLVLVAATSLNAVVLNCMAGQFYPNGYDRCVSSSGHSGIWSVVNYACEKAVAKSQNACATWLGSASSSTSTTIVANATTGTVPVKLWGMCTDYSNTSSSMQIMDDGGSISCGGSCNFTRSGKWGSPSSKSATLDIAKFINGAALTTVNGQRAYYRMVMVDRMHGGNTSMGLDFSPIYLVVGGEEDKPVPPPPPPSTCAAWGDPSSYTSSNENHGTTSIDIRIRNTASRFGGAGLGAWHAEWGNSGDVIYAMPTDTIGWHTCYWPGVQTTSDTEVSSVNGTNWGNYKELRDDICQNEDVRYKELKNAVKEVGGAWENNYRLEGAADNRSVGGWPIGNTDVRYSDSFLGIGLTDVGKTFVERAETYRPIDASISSSNPTKDVYRCPCCPDPPEQECETDDEGNESCEDVPCDETNDCYCCTNRYNSELKNASVNFGPTNDSASVIVPYNFVNETSVSVDSGVVYAGEDGMDLENVRTHTSERYNSVTRWPYATVVPNSRIKLFAYVTQNPNTFSGGLRGSGDGCSEIGGTKQCTEPENEVKKTLNEHGVLTGKWDTIWSYRKYNTFDASAGDYACFVSAVFPAEVTGDTVHNDGNKKPTWGGAQWRYSKPACHIIAKRPSFQVWGGDMYSNAVIDAATANKRNLYVNGYSKTSSGETLFGSWVEEGLMIGIGGKVKNETGFAFASGAAMGYNGDSSMAYAGVKNKNFDSDLSPLTISNYNNGWKVGSSGLYLYPDNTKRRELIDYWIKDGSGAGGTASGANIIYEHTGGRSIGNIKVSKGTTMIIEVDGALTITGDMTYDSSYQAANTVKDIPKTIVYADNINIQCNVAKVDAILITKQNGKVNTCSDADPDNDSDKKRGRQLKIFGMVITDEIVLGRTYGSAAWDGNEGKKDAQRAAAEVFDFDSSILLWSEFMASSAETDTLQVVYQNEIAPRY